MLSFYLKYLIFNNNNRSNIKKTSSSEHHKLRGEIIGPDRPLVHFLWDQTEKSNLLTSFFSINGCGFIR